MRPPTISHGASAPSAIPSPPPDPLDPGSTASGSAPYPSTSSTDPSDPLYSSQPSKKPKLSNKEKERLQREFEARLQKEADDRRKDQELQSAKAKIAELENQLKTANSRLSTQEGEKNKLEVEVAKLKAEKDVKASGTKANYLSTAEHELILERKKIERERAEEQLKDTHAKEKAQLEIEKKAVEAKRDEFQADLNKAKAEVTKLAEENSKLKPATPTKSALETRLETLLTQANQKAQAQGIATATCDGSCTEGKRLKSELAEIKTKLTEAEKKKSKWW